MVVEGKWQSGNWIGTLENGGVGLKYGSAWESKVPEDLKKEIEALIPKIISGEIKTVPEGVY